MIDIQGNEIRFAIVGIAIVASLAYPLPRIAAGEISARHMWMLIIGVLLLGCVVPLFSGIYVMNGNLPVHDALLLKGNSMLIGTAYTEVFFALRLIVLAIRRRGSASRW